MVGPDIGVIAARGGPPGDEKSIATAVG